MARHRRDASIDVQSPAALTEFRVPSFPLSSLESYRVSTPFTGFYRVFLVGKRMHLRGRLLPNDLHPIAAAVLPSFYRVFYCPNPKTKLGTRNSLRWRKKRGRLRHSSKSLSDNKKLGNVETMWAAIKRSEEEDPRRPRFPRFRSIFRPHLHTLCM